MKAQIIQSCADVDKLIKARKEELGMMWKDLGEKSGVSVGTMKNWETQKGIRLDTVLPVLEALDMELVIRPKAPF